MNERVTKVGGQVKQAFGKVRDTWKEQDPKRKKKILYIAIGLIALALGLMVFLNNYGGRYVVLYEGMGSDESVSAVSVLEVAGIPSRINSTGQLEVPSNQTNNAMAQLALQGIPSTTLDYNVFAQASGLTTTEFEKREYQIQQWQNRLQDTIKTYTGVQNAIVTLNISEDSDRAWDAEATKNTGSVSLTLMPGYVMAQSQVDAIRHMVGSSVGIAPEEVVVVDQNGGLLAGAGEEYDVDAMATSQFLERMGLETEVEQDLIQKAQNMISLPYPDSEDFRISCSVELDFDAVVTEMKEYIPLEDTIHGVVDYEEINAQMGLGQYAEGVAGETDNTDVPVYVDLNGDGAIDTVDYAQYREFAVSYVLEQITQDGPKLANATISVGINDTLDAQEVQQIRLMVAQATGIDVDNVGVTNFAIAQEAPEEPIEGLGTLFGIDIFYIYIAAGALLLLIIALVIILILRGKAKKKRLALEQAELLAEQEEAERIQAEIEERKKQLKNAAIGDQSENAIANEVREFARNNPEITANLLRNWLKEGE